MGLVGFKLHQRVKMKLRDGSEIRFDGMTPPLGIFREFSINKGADENDG